MPLADEAKLVRALQRQSPQHPEWRRPSEALTSRGAHPTRGSLALRQEAMAGGTPRLVTSLNVARADGSLGRAFAFDLVGFGFDQGELA